jgi:hypothetical protein
MEEAPENDKELLHSANVNGMTEIEKETKLQVNVDYFSIFQVYYRENGCLVFLEEGKYKCVFLISNFHCVLNVVCFLLGDSPVSVV